MTGQVKRQVFFSFHYANDVMRVAQIRNIGAIEGNKPISDNDWEQVKKKGDGAIEKWIDEQMEKRSCVIVLIGEETADRKWVQYEIKQAYKKGKGLFGIYIHNINCPRNGKCKKGKNPFDNFSAGNKKLSDIIKCYDPSSYDTYNYVSKNIEKWIETAIVDADARER